MAPVAEPADWPRGLRLELLLPLALLARPRLDLRAVLLPQPEPVLAEEPVWPAASAVAAEPVQRLLVVLVAAAVVPPAA